MSRSIFGQPEPVPPLTPGSYYFTNSQGAAQTTANHGIGTLRLAPYVANRALTIDRLGADVATVGEAGSKFRIGIYADDGTCRPGALLLDAGQINGDSATVQELTVSLSLGPGVYWIGGVVQSVTTTQPTMRVSVNWHPPVPLPAGTSVPAANANVHALSITGVTGALPGTFGTGYATAGSIARIFFRAA